MTVLPFRLTQADMCRLHNRYFNIEAQSKQGERVEAVPSWAYLHPLSALIVTGACLLTLATVWR